MTSEYKKDRVALAIIIVSYKAPQLLINCLELIYAQTRNINFQVIVVDNASFDNSREMILELFPEVKWIQMQYNAGFARANNEGIRQSDSDVVLLLNSDTLPENNCIEKCYESFVASPYVACGVQLLNPDRTPQISGSYFFKGGLNIVLPLPYLGNLFKLLGQLLMVKKPSVFEVTGNLEVDWINGACLMVKRDAINKAGLLDEDFFLYAEEAEWCSRLGKHGKLCIFGQYHVVHLQGATANQLFQSAGQGYYNLYDKKGLQIMVSNFVRIRKHLGIGWFLVNLFIYTLEIPVFFVCRFLHNLLALQNPFKYFNFVFGYCRNVFSLIGLTPKILVNKPYFYKVL